MAFCPRRAARGGEIERLVEAVIPHVTVGDDAAQIRTGGSGLDHQRQRRRIRRDDQILSQPALQAQPGDPECAVLVGELDVGGAVPGLRNAPRHATLPAIFDLPPHDRVIRLIQQRIAVRRHDQQRHQVLEHRAAPREQRGFPARMREPAPSANQLS